MPIFTDSPPDDHRNSGLRLIRTPEARALTGYVLSDNVTGTPTHFVGNRTVPCEGADCECCESGVPWRWHGYLAVLIEATQETVLFEMTAKASDSFKAYYERYGTTRGAHFKAQRLNARTNGRVLIQAKPADLAKVHLPKSPNVQKLLCHIWNISENQISKSTIKPRQPFDAVKIDRTKPELKPTNFDEAIPPPTANRKRVRPGKNGDK